MRNEFCKWSVWRYVSWQAMKTLHITDRSFCTLFNFKWVSWLGKRATVTKFLGFNKSTRNSHLNPIILKLCVTVDHAWHSSCWEHGWRFSWCWHGHCWSCVVVACGQSNVMVTILLTAPKKKQKSVKKQGWSNVRGHSGKVQTEVSTVDTRWSSGHAGRPTVGMHAGRTRVRSLTPHVRLHGPHSDHTLAEWWYQNTFSRYLY